MINKVIGGFFFCQCLCNGVLYQHMSKFKSLPCGTTLQRNLKHVYTCIHIYSVFNVLHINKMSNAIGSDLMRCNGILIYYISVLF